MAANMATEQPAPMLPALTDAPEVDLLAAPALGVLL